MPAAALSCRHIPGSRCLSLLGVLPSKHDLPPLGFHLPRLRPAVSLPAPLATHTPNLSTGSGVRGGRASTPQPGVIFGPALSTRLSADSRLCNGTVCCTSEPIQTGLLLRGCGTSQTCLKCQRCWKCATRGAAQCAVASRAVTRFGSGLEGACWAGHPLEVVGPWSSEAAGRPRCH